MFAKSGEITAPCGVPSLVSILRPSSNTPAFSHFWIRRMILRSPIRVLPHGSLPRMTRGQRGSLLLHCDGLSPSTSCRSSRRTAAQYLARALPCERFTAALASRTSCITWGRGGWLELPRGGLSPPILCQLVLAHSGVGPKRRTPSMPAGLLPPAAD